MTNGFRPEGSPPIVAAAGTPHGSAADLPVMTDFSSLGITSAPVFVDRTARRGERYAYQVVAETASGARSAASNVQVVPDPRPPATLERVHRELGGSALSARATMAAVARNQDARTATLRALARLRRGARRGSDVRFLIERLQRRVRYAGIAGGR
jgi:hypothetical protein